MTDFSRYERMNAIADHAGNHLDKVLFTAQVVDLGKAFALGAPQVFQDIIRDLEDEVDESAEIGRAMIAQLDARIH